MGKMCGKTRPAAPSGLGDQGTSSCGQKRPKDKGKVKGEGPLETVPDGTMVVDWFDTFLVSCFSLTAAKMYPIWALCATNKFLPVLYHYFMVCPLLWLQRHFGSPGNRRVKM